MKVLILAGGDSAERTISLQSGQAVYDALKGHYDVELCDPARLGQDDLILRAHRADAVLIMLHGRGGEDGAIQTLFEDHHIHSYLGANPAVSKLAFNKWALKQELRQAGILTPKAELVTRDQFIASPLSRQPFVLKPLDEGSSVDTYIVRQPPTELRQYDVAFDRHETMLLEELISGVEITVAVLGAQALPPVEIQPPEGQEFDYENKYNGATREICPPVSLGEPLVRQARELAVRIHRLIHCRDISRTDMIVTNDGRIYVLELNTLPGMTKESLVPKAAQAAGFTFQALAVELVRLAAQN